ncbi:Coiled-coil and C2 domain-containing protein 2A [Nowakowskiella sp. JEL0407]|nr:Coiled-coil and C2 domain-containing protein 2A [Nowakowskiella sp. JEL0407]
MNDESIDTASELSALQRALQRVSERREFRSTQVTSPIQSPSSSRPTSPPNKDDATDQAWKEPKYITSLPLSEQKKVILERAKQTVKRDGDLSSLSSFGRMSPDPTIQPTQSINALNSSNRYVRRPLSASRPTLSPTKKPHAYSSKNQLHSSKFDITTRSTQMLDSVGKSKTKLNRKSMGSLAFGSEFGGIDEVKRDWYQRKRNNKGLDKSRNELNNISELGSDDLTPIPSSIPVPNTKKVATKKPEKNIEQEIEEITRKFDKDLLETYIERRKWTAEFKLMKEKENSILWFADTEEDANENKEEFREISEEGYYKPKISSFIRDSNIKKLESRIKKSTSTGISPFLTQTKQLIIPPSPLNPQPTLTFLSSTLSTTYNDTDSKNQLLLTLPRKSTRFSLIDDTPTGTYTLVFDVIGIEFENHRLMNKEVREAKEVERLVGLLNERRESNIVVFLGRKLKALKSAYEEYKSMIEQANNPGIIDNDGIYIAKPVTKYSQKLDSELSRQNFDEAQETLRKYRDEIRRIRLERDMEEQMDRILEFKILQKWDTLKSIRNQQNFTSTSLKLIIRSEDVNYDEDMENLESEITAELQELEELHIEGQKSKLRDYELQLSKFNQTTRHQTSTKLDHHSDSSHIHDGSESTDESESLNENENKAARAFVKSSNKGRKSRARSFTENRDKIVTENKEDKFVAETKKSKKRSKSESNYKLKKKHSSLKEFDIDDPTYEVARPSKADLVSDRKPLHKIASRPEIYHTLDKIRNQEPVDVIDSDSKPATIRKPKEKSKKHKMRTSSHSHELDISSPSPPKLKAFNAKKARKNILKRINESRRPCGSPILKIQCTYNEPITLLEECPKHEQLRRREIESTNISIKLFYNEKEVTSTKPVPLDRLTFGTRFSANTVSAVQDGAARDVNNQKTPFTVISVQVREVPQSVRAVIVETGVLGDSYLGVVYIPIPEASNTMRFKDRVYQHLQFSGPKFYNHTGLITREHDSEEGWVNGKLWINLSWGVDQNGVSLGPGRQLIKETQKDYIWSVHGDPLKTIAPGGFVNLRKMMELIIGLQLDPQDPRNSHLISLKKLISDSQNGSKSFQEFWNSNKVFRLTIPKKLAEITLGVGENIPVLKKRFEVLFGRHRNQLRVKGPVPFEDDLITEELYERVIDPLSEEIIAKELLSSHFSAKSNLNISDTPTSNQPSNFEHRNFLKRIRAHQLLKEARLNRPHRLEDFVREERLVKTDPERSIFASFLQPRRPLKPHRTDRLMLLSAQPEKCEIVVQVLRGFNVPVRRKDSGIMDAAATKSTNPITVRSYVEITFQRKRARTTISEGPNPQWNQTLMLEINPPNGDFSPDSLMDGDMGTENLYFNLFDEYLVDMLKDDRERERTIHQKRERNWLGSFSIPFSTIYERSRIEGNFIVRVPAMTLAYEKNPSAGSLDNSVLVGIDSTSETILHIFIALEPPLLQPATLKIKVASDESEKSLRIARQWLQSLPFPKRYNAITAVDMRGNSVFIPRYIRPQALPPGIESVPQIIRYVSTIPHLSARAAFGGSSSGQNQLWATSEQVLEIGAGDSVEHAIMLCNFLGFMNKTCYVVLGYGIPEGRSAYVLLIEDIPQSLAVTAATSSNSMSQSQTISNTLNAKPSSVSLNMMGSGSGFLDNVPVIKEKPSKFFSFGRRSEPRRNSSQPAIESLGFGKQLKLFDPVRGEVYLTRDPFCPMKEVGCIFNSENVWSNIQKNADPARLNWDLDNQSCWKPLFTKAFSKPESPCIQKEQLNFMNFDKNYLTNLEHVLETTLTTKFEEWRAHRTTRWNRLCSRTFKAILLRLENEIFNGVDPPKNRHVRSAGSSSMKELNSLRSLYRISGFPLNFPYTDIHDAVEALYNIDVHSTTALDEEDEDGGDGSVEFALAVYCHGYPGKQISLWIYVASLTRLPVANLNSQTLLKSDRDISKITGIPKLVVETPGSSVSRSGLNLSNSSKPLHAQLKG